MIKLGEIYNGPLDGAQMIGCFSKKILGLNFCWWGFCQMHKWRWNITHIDLGPLSIYDIKRPYLWYPLVWLIKPLRVWYHWKYTNKKNEY